MSSSVIPAPPVSAKSAFPVTVRFAVPSSAIEAPLSRSSALAVLICESTVAVSSAMVTVPVELNVRVPKFVVSAGLPNVIVTPANTAPPVIVTFPLSIIDVKPVTLNAPAERFSPLPTPPGVCARTTVSLPVSVVVRPVTAVARTVSSAPFPDMKSLSLMNPASPAVTRL